MPKKNKAETQITIKKILDAASDQILRLGYDGMSYTTLSQQTGISRTGISHHFPKKTDFIKAMDSCIYDMFVKYLRLDDELEEFSKSWLVSLSSPEFISILRILFHHIVNGDNDIHYGQQGVDRLYKLLDERFGEESKRELEWLLGKSLVKMSFKA